MIRPINLNGNSEISVELYRNRKEVIADIPQEYIKEIVHDINTYSSMTIELPSVITHNGKSINYFLYDIIKGKQFIVIDINGSKQKFIIDDDIEEKEEKGGKVKVVKAYSYEKMLDNKTFIINEGLTRQLYKSPNETVEISDGILNLLEQQTNWKINFVDDDAKKDVGLYMQNKEIMLFNTFDKSNIVVGTVLFDKSGLNISSGDKALNMNILYPDMESYLNGKLQKKRKCNTFF